MTQPDLDPAAAEDIRGLFARPAVSDDQNHSETGPNSFHLTNRYWALVSGIAAPIGGTAIAVVLWCGFVFEFALTLIGKSPRVMTAGTKLMAMTMLLFCAVRIAATLSNGGLSGWQDCVPLLIFAAPLFMFPFALLSDGRIFMHLFCVGCAIGTVLATFVVMFQIVSGFPRVEGLLGNSAVFATILAISGTFGALNMRFSGRLFWLGAASLAAMLVCVIASETRTLWLMIPVNLFFVALLLQKSVAPKMLPRFAAAGVALLILTSAFFAPMLEKRFNDAVQDIQAIENQSDFDTSLGLRYVMWNAAVDAIAKRPILGYGLTHSMDEVHQAMKSRGMVGRNFTHPHNAFLFAMLNAGIFGLASLVAMLVVPLWIAFRSQAPFAVKLFIVILITNYFVAGLPGLIFNHDILDSFFVTAVIVGISACAPLSAGQRETP